MQKNRLVNQTLILLYGLPGSGKSFFARQASDLLHIPHISSDRIRYELFEKPTYSKEEQTIVLNLMYMMLEEYAKLGLSAIFDVSINKLQDRRAIRDLARKYNMTPLLVWLQADTESCFFRAKSRDLRKADDKYSTEISRELFDQIEKTMQAPQNEDALVISGKHLFDSQKNALLRRLKEMQLLVTEDMPAKSMAKPELVNLVSRAQMAAGRVDSGRRNVFIN